ncbi:MAG: Gfo/Idh/MocA family oxidoreductase [Planctomycetaceae bacterium]|nr:Gfo/Idh/MocA family oxidoreductase [Planctomycetaceae bacterium]
MTRLTRRDVLKATAAASTIFPLFTVAGTRASGQVVGANNRVRIGVAGIHGRGISHIDEYVRIPDVEVACLIDPDTRLFRGTSRRIAERANTEPKCVQDIRVALEDKSLDAISVATCNHWHALMTVWACQAGKHVYVEKPISHNVFEGRQCVEAARRYQRIVQHGTQQRSDPNRARQMAAIRSGKYGKLLVSKGYCCKPRWSIGFKPWAQPPADFDFDLWLGPAPLQPFHENLHPYNWHWFWDFGNGDTGNQGVHEMDVARWAIPNATLPTKVWSVGGRYMPEGRDQGETPNMQLSVYEFGETLLVFETRGLVDKPGAPPFKVANEFYTTEGVIRYDTWEVDGKSTTDFRFHPQDGSEPQLLTGGEAEVTPGGAFGSFVAAVRSGDPAQNNCDAEVGHYSAALCHLGNIACRLSQPLQFQQPPVPLAAQAQVAESLGIIDDNLRSAKIELANYNVLEFDPATEKFVSDQQANSLLTRWYRAPFVVPETV